MPEEPIKVTKRDLERLQFKRELIRKAQLTAPKGMLPGEVIPMIRRFAQETFMPMKAISPEVFRDKTIDEWEQAVKQYIMSRRPEFRQELVDNLKARYGGPQAPKAKGGKEVPQLLMMGAQKEVEKKAADLGPLWVRLVEEALGWRAR